MSDPEKIAALAKIAGWSDIQDYDRSGFRPVGSPPDGGPRRQVPDYLHAANAVIALLEKEGVFIDTQYDHRKWSVCIWLPDTLCRGTAPTFEEAGVRALLKAHGCEVGE